MRYFYCDFFRRSGETRKLNILEFLKEIGVSGFFDIAFMSLLIYTVLVWFKRTKAGFILTGISTFGLVYLLSRQFSLVLTTSVLQGFFAVILVAVIIIFQEELRRFFEQVSEEIKYFFERLLKRIRYFLVRMAGLGPNQKLRQFLERTSLLGPSPYPEKQKPAGSHPKELQILAQTLAEFATKKIGAIIVICGRNSVDRHLNGGVDLNGEISEQLLKSLFDPHSAGHDGAVIIEKGIVTKFSCLLPLSKNFKQIRQFGTRHAAALGLAELTDALCLVVSEERGTVSVAWNGEFHQVGTEQLNLILEKFNAEINPPDRRVPWYEFFKRNYREKAIAVAMTIALWFVFVYGSDLQYKSFNVSVVSTELASEYKVSEVDPKEVKITFVGARRDFYFLNEKEIKLFLPMPDTGEGTKTVTISESNLSFPKDISVESIVPRKVKVQVEETKPE